MDDDLVQLGVPEEKKEIKHEKPPVQSKKQSPWIVGVQVARKELGVTGFAAVKKGTELHERATEIKDEIKKNPKKLEYYLAKIEV